MAMAAVVSGGGVSSNTAGVSGGFAGVGVGVGGVGGGMCDLRHGGGS